MLLDLLDCVSGGKNNHHIGECQTNRNKLKYNFYKKKGHIAKVCITTLLDEKSLKRQLNSDSNSNNNENSTKYVHDSKGKIAFGINKIFVDSQDNNQNCEIIDI